jgi:HD-GYP domain-containing protein (c-di-GMP phosphodiesterase class II)
MTSHGSKLEELQLLVHSMQQLRVNENIEHLYDTTLKQFSRVVQANQVALILANEEQPYFYYWQHDYESAVKLPEALFLFNQYQHVQTATIVANVQYENNDVSPNSNISSMLRIPFQQDGEVAGAIIAFHINNEQFTQSQLEIGEIVANQAYDAIQNSLKLQALNQMFLTMIRTLTKTLDARDPYTAGHSERVAQYAIAIGEKLNLQESCLNNLYKAAILHDIGKIGIADEVLLKHDSLTEQEFNLVKEHTNIGAAILETLEPKSSMKYAVQTARWHHERMDGSGYPDQLKGDAIPIFARIVGVADAFDAMTSTRPYSEALSFEEAKNELIRCKGTVFDEEIVNTFVEILHKQYPDRF